MSNKIRHLRIQLKMSTNNSLIIILLFLLFLGGCSVASYIPEGELFYSGMKGIDYEGDNKSINNRQARKDLESVLNYKPNNSFFGSSSLRLPFTYPFYINRHFSNSKFFLGRWLYKTFGDDPILISQVNPDLRVSIGEQILREYGYFHSWIEPQVHIHGKDSIQAKVSYEVLMGEPHLLDSISYQIPIQPKSLPDLFSSEESLLKRGEPFSVPTLNNERKRISSLLRGEGYYFFRPENIFYHADTLEVPQRVQLRVKLSDKMLPEAYQPWRIGRITYNLRDAENSVLTDSVFHEGVLYRFSGKTPVRVSMLEPRIKILRDSLYSEEREQNTISHMAELNTFAYTGVSYTPRQEDGRNLLDVDITSRLDLPYFTELEGTYKFKSNNQTGPGLSFSVNKKNLFGGGELLSILLRSSYEWETRPSTSSGNSWDINSYELGLQTSITFPRIFPFYSHRSIDFPVSSRIGLSGVLLNRANFYRQGRFALDLAYRFEPNHFVHHVFTPISITYNHILHKTDRFIEAIEANPALALSFRNQLIPQFSYLFGFEYQEPWSRHGFSVETYVAEAGNIFSLAHLGKKNESGEPNKVLGTPFAQFVKGTLELRYNFRFNDRFQIASRAFAGAIYSYGNMKVAPYREQFYAGGANSIRGFNVRALGPGGYNPLTSDPMDFLDRTGDFRFEGNLELRYRMFGSLELATFLDAGNIWLLRNDPNRPNGTLSGAHFWDDLALGTGLGLRYDLSYIVLRFDVGLGLHKPTREPSQYFNTFGERMPLVFHLAIGYPF